jgi:hypothetical protein
MISIPISSLTKVTRATLWNPFRHADASEVPEIKSFHRVIATILLHREVD